MKEVQRALPHASVIYFGDTARVPYGGKSPETIVRYSIENSIFLLENEIDVLVIACNTAASAAISKLRSIFNIPIIGVIEPGAEKAVSITKNKKIAVLGTKATIQSGSYQKEIEKRLPDALLFPVACPLFVPFVEEGLLDHPSLRLLVKEYLFPLKREKIDTLLLGCTHYPLLKHLIQEEVGDDIIIVDSATTCAEKVASLLKQENTDFLACAENHYYVSDDPAKFKEAAEKLFKQTLVHVHTIRREPLGI